MFRLILAKAIRSFFDSYNAILTCFILTYLGFCIMIVTRSGGRTLRVLGLHARLSSSEVSVVAVVTRPPYAPVVSIGKAPYGGEHVDTLGIMEATTAGSRLL